jgi:PKD repeat protein
MTSSPALVSESSGSGTTSATHTYLSPGLYTVSVDVNDGDGGIATRSIQIRVNTPPTANAGGPYAGPEGTLLTLGGTATDPDPDVLTTNWTFVVTGAPPSACTFGATNTLAPTVLCTDNASVAATLAVSDGVHPAVLSVATLTVGNVAPSLSGFTVTASPVGVGSTVNASVSFSDAGTSDTHTGTISWGDGTTPASVSETLGAGTASGTHAYALPGTYSVSITVTDDDGDSSTTALATVVVNSPPTASAGGPYTVNEGSPLNLAGTATDPEMDPLTISWSFVVAGGPGTACMSTGTGTVTPTITCNDDALVTATMTADDGINTPVTSAPTTISVMNVGPVIGPVNLSPVSVPLGGTVNLTVAFTDAGTNDTHPIASVNWGFAQGSSTPVITESGGSGSATASHVYNNGTGTFTVKVLIGDDDLDTASRTATVTVT